MWQELQVWSVDHCILMIMKIHHSTTHFDVVLYFLLIKFSFHSSKGSQYIQLLRRSSILRYKESGSIIPATCKKRPMTIIKWCLLPTSIDHNWLCWMDMTEKNHTKRGTSHPSSSSSQSSPSSKFHCSSIISSMLSNPWNNWLKHMVVRSEKWP